MPMRPCLDCSRLTRNASRCDGCSAKWSAVNNARRGSSSARGYGAKWRAMRAAVIAEHVALYGAVCPGYGVPGHVSDDLTLDHIIPKVRGGTDERSNLGVLCRQCNSRKKDAYTA
jgi:5-methylcytosine-specific restriction protein A